MISIIVPVYNEYDVINYFYAELIKVIDTISKKFEIIFVDDGSIDKSLQEIKKLTKDKRVKFISFTKNFGKEAAMLAGLTAARGNYVTVMDADLQDSPILLKEMITILDEGTYDIVSVKSKHRKQTLKRRFFSKIFYKIANNVCEVSMIDGERDYKLMNKYVVNSILKFDEYNRFFRGIVNSLGYKTKTIECESIERKKGKSKFNLKKLFKYGMDALLNFSNLSLIINLIFSLIAFVIGTIVFIFDIINNSFDNYLLIIVLLLFSIISFELSILSNYTYKTYLETKKRPKYIIKEKLGCDL